MRPLWKDIVTAVFMGMILPGLLVNLALMLQDSRQSESIMTEEPMSIDSGISMRLRTPAGGVEEMDLEEYLTGVVLAEMPASFEPEALKAQAVAARTYTRKAYVTGGKHGDGSLCTNPACCQAYVSEADYFSQGGTQEGLKKVQNAVYATFGYALTYEGELIEAPYFSCSGGSTEDAVAVWGTDYPYLQAKVSPGEENADHYTDTVQFSAREFQESLGKQLPGTPKSWFGLTAYTEGGGVATMVIGGEAYSGTELRTLLGLRSTAFQISTDGDILTITTQGYGHRVGMSQYGAEAMALSGSDFSQILAYYYPGTELTKIKQ